MTSKEILDDQNRKFKNTVQQAPVGITILRGADLVVEMANETYLQIVDRTEEEFIGRPLYHSLPEVKESTAPLMEKVLTTGVSHHGFEFPVFLNRYGNKELTYFNFIYQALREENGEISGVIVVANEVTETVQARRQVEDTKERLRLAVEAAGLGDWDLDLATRHIVHSPRLSEIFGYDPSVALTHQQMRAQLLPGDLENIAKKAFDKALKSGSLSYEARVIKPDGTICWIMNKGTVFYDEQHKPVKMIGAVRDITEEKAFSQELERQVQERTGELGIKNEELEKMNADLKSFAYISSHDLQEPLRKIQAFAGRIAEMERNNLSDKGLDYFERIQKSAATMQTLIKDLLTYARTNSNEKVFVQTSINKILGEAEEELRELTETKKAVIKAEDLGYASVIPFQFRQLLINLIGNSLKFAKPDEPAFIELKHGLVSGSQMGINAIHTEPLYYHLQIIDNGIGFDPVYKDRIFEIFQRLNSKDLYKGTGIGLAIVKRIVDNHNGFITASGELNKGARFDVYIPAGSGSN